MEWERDPDLSLSPETLTPLTRLSERDRGLTHARSLLRQIVHKNPRARILELRASRRERTRPLLDCLGTPEPGRFLASLYHFTDESEDEVRATREELAAWGRFVAVDRLNIAEDPAAQGFELGSYDVLVAFGEWGGEGDYDPEVLDNVYDLIKPGGKFLVVQVTRFALGTEQDRGPGSRHYKFTNVGYDRVDVFVYDFRTDDYFTMTTVISRKPVARARVPASKRVVVVTGQGVPSEWLDALRRAISMIRRGAQPGALPETYSLESTPSTTYAEKICVFLGEMQPLDTAAGLENVKAMATSCKGLLWVTRGGLGNEKLGAGVAGEFLRGMKDECPGATLMALDLDPGAKLWSDEEVSAIVKIVKITFSKRVPEALLSDELEYAVRNGDFLVPRRVR